MASEYFTRQSLKTLAQVLRGNPKPPVEIGGKDKLLTLF